MPFFYPAHLTSFKVVAALPQKTCRALAAFASDKKESLFAPILSLTLSSAFVRKVIIALRSKTPTCFLSRDMR